MSDFDLFYSDATQLAERIRTGAVSSAKVVQAHLDRIAAIDPKLNSIVTLNPTALKEAEAADKAIASGEKGLGPLHGVPFTVKDSIDTAKVPTQRGSLVFEGRTPEEDATAVARMRAAGAILLAKTNIPEFSYGTESNNPLSSRSNNPWNVDKTPGGSSGGESAAIAAGLSPLGLGTDLAISVRGPASQTGIVALKPTHGRIPMTGAWPRNPRRFWHLGPMARSIRDLEVAYKIMAGPDGQDAFSTIANHGHDAPKKGSLKVGWLVEPGFGAIHPEVRDVVIAAAKALSRTGNTVDKVQIPALERDFALDVFLRIHVNEMSRDAAAATQDFPREKLSPTIRGLIDTPQTSMQDFIDAEQAADRLRDGFAQVFFDHDALLMPVLPIPAHDHGMTEFTIDGKTENALHVMAATVPLNVTGLPGLSMRFGTSKDGLPINVQLVGSWYAEATILHLAKQLEAESTVKDLRPDL